MRDVIPEPVFSEIQEHLSTRSADAVRGWHSASEDEDTLTGDFGAHLRTDWRFVAVPQGPWEWRVDYKKFRGRGKEAVEKRLGADGVVLIEVRPQSGVLVTKGVLFQAKKDAGSSRRDLLEQVQKMEAEAPGGSAVFEFGPDGYRADSGEAMLGRFGHTQRRIPRPSKPMGDYLAREFLVCTAGLRGMYYDAVRENLLIPADDGIRTIPISLRHRFRVQVAKASPGHRNW